MSMYLLLHTKLDTLTHDPLSPCGTTSSRHVWWCCLPSKNHPLDRVLILLFPLHKVPSLQAAQEDWSFMYPALHLQQLIEEEPESILK